MSTFPVDLGFRRYNHSDFTGRNYVGSVPDFLSDAMATLLDPWTGYIETAYPFLPSLRSFSAQASAGRLWGPGKQLFMVSPDKLQALVITLTKYNVVSGEVEAVVDSIYANQGKLRSYKKWYLKEPLERSYDHSSDDPVAISAGGLGSSLIESPEKIREDLGMGSNRAHTLEFFDDFMAGVTDSGWGADATQLHTDHACRGVYEIATSAGTKNMAQTPTYKLTDFDLHWRIKIPALSNGVSVNRMRVGLSSIGSYGTDDSSIYIEYYESSSDNWRYGVSSNSGGGTTSVSNSALAVDTDWHVARIVKSGSTISFYIDATLLGTKTSSQVGPLAMGLHAQNKKEAGGLADALHLDYVRMVAKTDRS